MHTSMHIPAGTHFCFLYRLTLVCRKQWFTYIYTYGKSVNEYIIHKRTLLENVVTRKQKNKQVKTNKRTQEVKIPTPEHHGE